MTVDVTGAQDANGNAQQDYTPLAEFSIDTANPTVTGVRSANDLLITDADTAPARDGDVQRGDGRRRHPTLTFAPDVASTLAWPAAAGRRQSDLHRDL